MHRLATKLLFVAAASVAMTAAAESQKPASTSDRITRLEAQNAELRERLEALEQQKPALPENVQNFLSETEISGYVSTSYFYNFNDPSNRENTGRGFDRKHDEFMLNKFVLGLDKAVEYNATEWQAGYRGKVIFGQDAEYTQAQGLSIGDQGDLFEANITLNVPVGNGLLVTFGKFETTIGYESTFLEENAANWSAGNQWNFIAPFTHTGLLLDYKFNEEWQNQFSINNGWDNVEDNNHAKSFVDTITYTYSEATSAAISGYAGPEEDDNTSDWRKGIDLVFSTSPAEMWTTALEFDYGAQENGAADGGQAVYLAAGAWLSYDPEETWGLAFRADYLNDRDGYFTSERPALAPFAVNDGQELYSLTLTLNLKPLKNVRISPEVRFDHSTLDTAFDGEQDQVTLGVGAAYFF
jgi:hypothetical protein